MVNKPKRLTGLVQKDKDRDWRIKGRPVSPPQNPAESMSEFTEPLVVATPRQFTGYNSY
jgi:hypothetical protein